MWVYVCGGGNECGCMCVVGGMSMGVCVSVGGGDECGWVGVSMSFETFVSSTACTHAHMMVF